MDMTKRHTNPHTKPCKQKSSNKTDTFIPKLKQTKQQESWAIASHRTDCRSH